MDMNSFTIGQLSRQTGISNETIRYFERVGLLASAPRTKGGYRLYNDDDLRRLNFVKKGRGLGFTPDEVRNMLALTSSAGSDAAGRRTAVKAVRRKIADLARLEVLLALASDPHARDEDLRCRFIEFSMGHLTDQGE